jgi:hypothetical protein
VSSDYDWWYSSDQQIAEESLLLLAEQYCHRANVEPQFLVLPTVEVAKHSLFGISQYLGFYQMSQERKS